MWDELVARDGQAYLEPQDVVSRLKANFAYVETSEEDARRHVLEIIQQIQLLRLAGRPVKEGHLARLERAEERAICVHFADELGSDAPLLSTPLIPGEPIVFEYGSPEERRAAMPLVSRCAEVLGYTIMERMVA